MKTLLRITLLSLLTIFIKAGTWAQAPLPFSYQTPNTFGKGVSIMPLAPSLTSTAVLAPSFYFGDTQGVAVDAAGNVYVASSDPATIIKIAAGTGATSTLGSGFTFGGPTGVAVDATGNVYVADYNLGQVLEIASGNGAVTPIGSGFTNPTGVAVDAAGNVYVADIGAAAVLQVAAGNGAITTLGSGFSQPYGVAVDAHGNVYVGDVGNDAVYQIAAGNGPVTSLGSGFGRPTGVAVDAAGNVYVADAGNSVIDEIAAGNGNVTQLGGGFNSPTGLAVDASGNVYVADWGNGLIIEIFATPPVATYSITPALPSGLTINSGTGVISGTPAVFSPQTTYYVTAANTAGKAKDSLAITVTLPNITYTTPNVFTKGTAIAPLTVMLPDTLGTGATFSYPSGVAVDGAGNVYIADYNVNGTGGVFKVAAGGGGITAIGSGYINPAGVAVDAAGNVYFSNYGGGNIVKIAAGTGNITTVASGIAGSPNGMAVDGAGNLYVAPQNQSTVIKIAAGTGNITHLGSGFRDPAGIAVDAAGNVYVADQGNSTITKITAGAGTLVTLGSGFHTCTGVALDAAGNVYVADYGNGLLKKIALGNGPVSIVASLSGIYGVALDHSGNIYITSVYSGLVEELVVNSAPAASYTISPALPTGLAINAANGTISGTPNVLTPQKEYYVTATNGTNTASDSFAITVNDVPPSGLTYPTPNVFAEGTAITPLTPSLTGGGPVTGYAISPALPAGLAINATTGAIGGTPTALLAATPFVVTASNSGGSTNDTLAIAVTGIAYTTPKNFYLGQAVVLPPMVDGSTPTGYSISPGLPAGLAINAATGVISGTTTGLSGTTTYTVTAQYAHGTAKTTLAIAVTLPPPPGAFSYPTPEVFLKNATITAVAPISSAGKQTTIGSGFAQAVNVATDAAGDVFVLDYRTRKISKITPGGTQTVFAAGFREPYAISQTVDAAGNLYVADDGTKAIYKITPGGTQTTAASNIANMQGLTVDAAGDLYVTTRSTVYKIAAGSTTHTIIATGFDYLAGIAVDATNNVYAVDNEAQVVYKITPTGIKTTVGSGIAYPWAVVLDAQGNIYITDVAYDVYNDAYNKRTTNGLPTHAKPLGYNSEPISEVYKITPAGVQTTIGSGFEGPYGVAVDAQGNVYVADDYYPYIIKINAAGGPVTAYSVTPTLPTGVYINKSTGVITGYPTALSPQTTYTVTGRNSGGFATAALAITVTGAGAPGSFGYQTPDTLAAGTPITPLAPKADTLVTTSANVSQPLWVAADQSGNVYATESVRGIIKILGITPTLPANSANVFEYGPGGVITSIGQGLQEPEGVAVDFSGNIYVADQGTGNVYKITQGGVQTTVATGFEEPLGVAVDKAGNVYVADAGAPAVYKITPGGTPTTLGSGFEMPLGVAVDGVGNLYVLDGRAKKVYKITPGGTQTTWQPLSSLTVPGGIAADGASNVYVTDQSTGKVYKITSAHVQSVVGTGLNNPSAVGVDGFGNLYIANYGGNNVVKISLAGGAANGYTISPALPAGLIINPTTGIISGTPTAGSVQTTYTVTASNVNGTSTSDPLTISVGITDSWTGAADSLWSNPNNWTTRATPNATTNVSIPAGTPYNPVVKSAGYVQSMAISPGATLTINSGDTLYIAGNVTDSGTINAAGGIAFNGTAAQTFTGGLTANNFIVNNSAGLTLLGGTTTVTGIYTPQAGMLATNGNLVLASTATGTASVAQGSGNYITGGVTVQRYIPAKRAWRFLTAPLSNPGTIYANWQNNGIVNGYTGVDIWSPAGGGGMRKGGVAPSIQTYSVSNDTWVGATNTNATLLGTANGSADNLPYSTFVTGPYGSGLIADNTGSIATTLAATGSLQTGAQQFNFTGLAAGNYLAVGNPYASPVDFTNLVRTNVKNTMWAWDPERANTAYGGYVTFSWDAVGNTYDQDIPASQTAQTHFIQSGQAILVQAVNAGAAAVTFNETDKAAASTATNAVFGIQPAAMAQQMRITLNRASQPVDAVLAKFNNHYSSGTNNYATKQYGYDEALAFTVGQDYFSIERRPEPVAGDTLFLSLSGLTANTGYSFTIAPQEMGELRSVNAWLVDGYLKTQTPISLTATSTLAFETGSDKGSASATRFAIVFKQLGFTKLNTNIKAQQAGQAIQVEWATPAEQGIVRYQLQKSADGQNFTNATSATARNSGNTETYEFTDAQPNDGYNYYRTQVLNSDGTVSYSQVAKVLVTSGRGAFTAYPNPAVRNQQVTIGLSKLQTGKYRLDLYDAQGRLLLTKTITHDGYTATQQLTLPAGIAAGVYSLVLTGEKGNAWKQQLMVD